MESLPIPDEQLLKILYELSTKDLTEMANTSSHFRNLINAPGFWDRKGQHMTKSRTLPISSKHPRRNIYNVTNWKEYIVVIESIQKLINSLIHRLKVIDEPDYERDEHGDVDDDDLANRSPNITIQLRENKSELKKEFYIFKQLGEITVIYGDSETEEKIRAAETGIQGLLEWMFSVINTAEISYIYFSSDRVRLFQAVF